MKMKAEGVRKIWDRYKYAALVALIGAGLLLWPGGERNSGGGLPIGQEKAEPPELQAQLEDILSTVSGVGQVRVLLTVESDGERQLAQDMELESGRRIPRTGEPWWCARGETGRKCVWR